MHLVMISATLLSSIESGHAVGCVSPHSGFLQIPVVAASIQVPVGTPSVSLSFWLFSAPAKCFILDLAGFLLSPFLS